MNKRVNIHLLNIIIFLQGFVFYAPIATIYRENRGISILQIFLIESIYMIGIIFLEIPWGVFADKFGYKKTLVLANFIFLMSKVIFFKANSFYMFLFERLLLAVAISGCIISAGINPTIGVASNYSLEMGLIICCVIGFISIILISIYKVRIDL